MRLIELNTTTGKTAVLPTGGLTVAETKLGSIEIACGGMVFTIDPAKHSYEQLVNIFNAELEQWHP